MLTIIHNFPEISILLINLTMILIAYFVVFPRIPKGNLRKIIRFDLAFSLAALFIAGLLFWGSQIDFNLIFFPVHWIVFSIVSYLLLETLFYFSYFKKYKIKTIVGSEEAGEVIPIKRKRGYTSMFKPLSPRISIIEDAGDFANQLDNFEKIFEKNLISTEENSVEIFFVEIAKEFIRKLRKNNDFKNYENLDLDDSFIEVDSEGQTRIFLKHKENLKTNLNGIEIYISYEISVDFFGETHSHWAVVGNKFYFDEKWKDDERVDVSKEEKWEYSEIDDAVSELNLYYPTKILKISWNEHSIASGVWDKKINRFHIIKYIRPIIFLKRLFMPWIKKEQEAIYIDWKPKVENQRTITKKEILEKLRDFLEHKISRKELVVWAKNIDDLYEKQKIKFEYYELDSTIYAMMEAEAGIDRLVKKIKRAKNKSLEKGVLISFEEEDYDLPKNGVENMIKWLEKLK